MSGKNTMDQMMDRFKCKVVKNIVDDRTSIEGEVFITPRMPEHDGTEIDGVKKPYCFISAHRADYIKKLFCGRYEVSDPFIPGIDSDLTFSPVVPDKEEDLGK